MLKIPAQGDGVQGISRAVGRTGEGGSALGWRLVVIPTWTSEAIKHLREIQELQFTELKKVWVTG